MMTPKLSNFLAVMLMLLGLVAAQQSTSVRSSAAPSVTSATGKSTSAPGKSAATTTSGTAAKSSASASATTTKKSAGSRGAGAGDSTLITVSLAAGLVVFGVAMS
ncbi:hypothetical protein O9K51_10843 [Purpureocillium lavendulum]|uniref:Uncharacterized protein n=1 Tax=Purpureocillium lavendulum TaxID=1247861 RepID=A0AB34FB75_9HYPO|nr:hypothetical protein O9K51_10843 [Purpureocillium lavendulum]